MKTLKRILLVAASLLMLVSCAEEGIYPRKSRGTVRIVSYNVGVFGKFDLSSEKYTAGLMNELQADVIALQELDSCTTRSGVERFQPEVFAGEMGEQWDYTYAAALKSYKEGSYGIGEVWNTDKLKAVKKFHVMLPKGEAKETRALAVVEYENMVVASTHLNGHASSLAPSAEIITNTLVGLYGNTDKPVFLCGDFNARPDNPVIIHLQNDWTILSAEGATGVGGKNRGREVNTIEDVLGGCIDYIMILKNEAKYELVNTGICFKFETGDVFESSDHLPVYVDVKLQK